MYSEGYRGQHLQQLAAKREQQLRSLPTKEPDATSGSTRATFKAVADDLMITSAHEPETVVYDSARLAVKPARIRGSRLQGFTGIDRQWRDSEFPISLAKNIYQTRQGQTGRIARQTPRYMGQSTPDLKTARPISDMNLQECKPSTCKVVA